MPERLRTLRQTVFTTLGAAGVVPEKDCIVQAQRRNEVSPALEF